MSEKLTQRTELSTAPDALDLFHVVDTSDTTDSAEGTSKKITYSNLIPDASTTVKGKVELATDAETITGTDAARAMTPSNLTAKIDTDGTLAGNLDTRIPSQKAVKTYVDTEISGVGGGGNADNLLKNGNFINNTTNGYGSTPDDWTSSSANPVQGSFPSLTLQNLIDITGVTSGDIEGLWLLNEASGNAVDSSSNTYTLTDVNTVGSSSDGVLPLVRDFEISNSEYFNIADASCPNLEISGSQTWFAFFKAESLASIGMLMNKRIANASIAGKFFQVKTSGVVGVEFPGLTTTTTLDSDVVIETGKWYLAVAVYDSANSKIKVWVNGIKKEATASGTMTDTNGIFAIGARPHTVPDLYYDGLLGPCGILSVALSDDQVKGLFAATLYKGVKVRRATTNAYLYQRFTKELVERLKGKTVALRADFYQEAASTAQVSIHQTMADGTTDESIISSTDATTGSWVSKFATGTLENDVVTIEIRLKNSTTDGSVWFKNVSLYEGNSLLPFSNSGEDWSRFKRALMLEIGDFVKGYRVEGDLGYFQGAHTTTTLPRFGDIGYDTSNNRLYINQAGTVKYTAMT